MILLKIQIVDKKTMKEKYDFEKIIKLLVENKNNLNNESLKKMYIRRCINDKFFL